MSEKLLSELSEEEIKIFAKSFDTIIVFLEGVLTASGREIIGSTRAIDILQKCGKRILYFSKDCTLSRRQIAEKMGKINYDPKPNEVLCITSLMAKYLKKRLDERKIYVIGSAGISEELNFVGLPNFGTGPEVLNTDLATFVHSYTDEPEVGAVVVGLDEHFSYPKMLRAASYLSVKDVMHVACIGRTKVTAALVACIETCSEKRALIFDHSTSLIKETLADGYRIVPERTLIIGPGNDDDICLTRFHRFEDFLSTSFDYETPLFKNVRKTTDGNSDESIIHANDLAELASRLKIS